MAANSHTCTPIYFNINLNFLPLRTKNQITSSFKMQKTNYYEMTEKKEKRNKNCGNQLNRILPDKRQTKK